MRQLESAPFRQLQLLATGGGVAPPAPVPTAAAMGGCEPLLLVEQAHSMIKRGVHLHLM